MDNVFTNIQEYYLRVGSIDLGISNHRGIWLAIDFPVKQSTEKIVISGPITEFGKFCLHKSLELVDWNVITNNYSDPNKSFQELIHVIQHNVFLYFAEKIVKASHYKSVRWYSLLSTQKHEK